MKEETILEWISPEHHFDRKANDWYWILGVITLGASVLAFYFDDFLFAGIGTRHAHRQHVGFGA